MEKDYVDYSTLAAIIAPQTQALQAIAMRPQKTSAYTTTTSTPRALADMIANRDRIGTATRELDDALKARETLGYTLANSLANIPQQQGYGSWLSDLARGFGSGATMRTNAQVDRAQKAYDAQMKDLAEILAYDKAMGETQVQNQVMGYTPMEYGATGGKGAGSGTTGSGGGTTGSTVTFQNIPVAKKADWDYWIKNWDEARPSELDYRGSEWGRQFQNWQVRKGGGSAVENAARTDFEAFKDINYLPMARNTLKGAGPITDFEDKKYTRWLSEVRDPVQLKDLTIRMIADVGSKNGWTEQMMHQAAGTFGVLSPKNQLTGNQAKQLPWRTEEYGKTPTKEKTEGSNDGWTELGNGIRIRKVQ